MCLCRNNPCTCSVYAPVQRSLFTASRTRVRAAKARKRISVHFKDGGYLFLNRVKSIDRILNTLVIWTSYGTKALTLYVEEIRSFEVTPDVA